MPHNERGERVRKNKDTNRRQDVDSATKAYEGKARVCPTCGQKVSASNQGGAAVGGGT